MLAARSPLNVLEAFDLLDNCTQTKCSVTGNAGESGKPRYVIGGEAALDK